MPPEDMGSVTLWIDRLKAADQDAAQRVWERYFDRLVRFARKRLSQMQGRRVAADEEDAVLSAFDSFCEGAAHGRFPQLQDRDDLWRLLVVITARKVLDQVRHDRRKTRGGGRGAQESAQPAGVEEDEPDYLDRIVGREPTPEFAAMVAEQSRQLLDRLEDESLRRIALWKMEG